ncbi:MAG: MFS transporter [Nocardia sp.]|nr:MFS transporter [Nocardia sp.]
MTTHPDSIAPAEPAPTPRRFTRKRSAGTIITILLLVEVISAFETSMVFAAIPTMIRDFNSDAGTVSWVATSFLLVAAASAAVCGRIGDMYGRERVLVVILAAATVGSLISAMADGIGMVIVGRAIQGVAGAILPLCIGLAREHLPKAKLPVAVAVISGAAVAAGAAAAYIAGLMIDYASWHMIFIVAAVYAAAMLVLVLFVLPWRPPTGTTQQIDYLGAIVFAPAIAAILLGINKISSWGLFDIKTLGLILGGIAVLALWARWELQVKDPIANLRLFTDRKISITMIATLTLAVGPLSVSNMIYALVLQSPKDAPFGVGMTPSDAGLLTLIAALIAYCLTPLSGRISRTMGSRVSLLIGGATFVLAGLILFVSHHSMIGVFAAVFFASAATSFAYTALPNLIVESVPAENTSEAAGLNTVIRTGGQGVGTSIAATLLASSAVAGVSTGAGLNMVIAMGIIGTLLTIGLTLMLKRGSAYTA